MHVFKYRVILNELIARCKFVYGMVQADSFDQARDKVFNHYKACCASRDNVNLNVMVFCDDIFQTHHE